MFHLISTEYGCHPPFIAIQTALYRSPEVALGYSCDHTSDMWGLGVTLLEMMIGRSPFDTTNEVTLMEDWIRIFGEFPREMLDGASNINTYAGKSIKERVLTNYSPSPVRFYL